VDNQIILRCSNRHEWLSEESDEHRYKNIKSFFYKMYEQHYKPGSVSDDHLS